MKLSNDLIGKKVVDLQYKNIEPDYEYEIITAIGESQHLSKRKYADIEMSSECPQPNSTYDRYEFYEEPKKERKLVKKVGYIAIRQDVNGYVWQGGQVHPLKQEALDDSTINYVIGVQEITYEVFEDAE